MGIQRQSIVDRRSLSRSTNLCQELGRSKSPLKREKHPNLGKSSFRISRLHKWQGRSLKDIRRYLSMLELCRLHFSIKSHYLIYLTSSLNHSFTLSAAFITNATKPNIASIKNLYFDTLISNSLMILFSTSVEFSM